MLTELAIPEGVETIGNYAFYECAGLRKIVIPDGIRAIGSCAFSGCVGFAHVELPDSLEYVGDDAFFGCVSLDAETQARLAELNARTKRSL